MDNCRFKKKLSVLFPYFCVEPRKTIPVRHQAVQPVGPSLHHGPAFLPVIGPVVNAADSALDMSQGCLNHVRAITQGIERRTAQGTETVGRHLLVGEPH